MKRKQWTALILTGLLSTTVLLSGCGSNNNKASESPPSSAQTSTPPSASPTGTNNDAQETDAPKVDPLGKYDPPIQLSTVLEIRNGAKYRSGESHESNSMTKMIADELGIAVNYLWTSPVAQYDQKLNLMIASGELPDLTMVSAQQLAQLVENNQLEDLTQVYEAHASDLTKELMVEDGGRAMQSATFNDKLYAIPMTGSDLDSSNVLWVRQDWLDKLQLQVPTTMDDLAAVAEAFTTKDPDGNKTNDTFGLGITKDMLGGNASLDGFFNGYHAYPTIWVKGADGNLAYGGVQPEVKAALTRLHEMYKAGYIDTEFGVSDIQKVSEMISSNKIGMFFGKMTSPIYPLNDAVLKNPEMDWRAYAIPTADGNAASTQLDFSVKRYFVIKKGYAHPEAVVKLMNLSWELLYGKGELQKRIYPIMTDADPQIYFTLRAGRVVYGDRPLKNLNAHLNVKKVLESKDESLLQNDEERDIYKGMLPYIESQKTEAYSSYGLFGPKGPFSIINDYKNNGLLVSSEFYGAPTKTMGERASTLNKLLLESFTKIIMGRDSVDSFDKFVSDWKKLGGDDITSEVNAWSQGR